MWHHLMDLYSTVCVCGGGGGPIFSKEGPTFSGMWGGPTFSRGGSICSFLWKTYRTCDFHGGSETPVPPLDLHMPGDKKVLVQGVPCFTYRLLYGRGVPLGHNGIGVAILARGYKLQTNQNS